jgi:hypothetical protein
VATFGPSQARAGSDGFSLGAAESYGILFEGGGGNTLQVNGFNTVNPGIPLGITGDIGIGNPTGLNNAAFSSAGPGTINGNVDFAGTVNHASFSNTTFNGVVHTGVSNVTSALNTVNLLSTNLGGEAVQTSVAFSVSNGHPQTIAATGGSQITNPADPNFGTFVYRVTSFSLNAHDGSALTITGSRNDFVVFNISSSVNIQAPIVLSGGITPDQVLFNFVGGSNLTGGPTIHTSTSPLATLNGTFLDPNGVITMDAVGVHGHIFGGDSQNMQLVSNFGFIIPEPACPRSSRSRAVWSWRRWASPGL